MAIENFRNNDTSNHLGKLPYWGSHLDSWLDDSSRNYSQIELFEQSYTIFKTSEFDADENVVQGNEMSQYEMRSLNSRCRLAKKPDKPTFGLTFDGVGKQKNDESGSVHPENMNERDKNKSKTLLNDGTRDSGDTSKPIPLEQGNTEDDRKGKGVNPQPIKGCNCQELTPEQKERKEKPPPCDCQQKKHKEKLGKNKKPTDCAECDRIKLNANLIRAIQRINELQAQRRLTESEVKMILEEEYHGDIFGYKDKKPKGLTVGKKVEGELPLQRISEREEEMRAEFKEIIQNEVTKFEEHKNKKKSTAPKIITPKESPKTVEVEKPKKKKKKRLAETTAELEETLKWMYPGNYFGHKHCIPPLKLVPKTMGWLWNSSKGAGLIKPGRGWVPGAIRQDVIEVIKNARKDRRGVVEDEEERTIARSSQRSGNSRSRDNIRSHADKYCPTFHMHKKDGYYYFSLYPVKTEEYDKLKEEPKPTMFKISAKHPDDGSEEWSTDDDSYEIEFVTPSAMRKQVKKPVKKAISQQYLEEDYNLRLKREKSAPQAEKKEEIKKKDKKDKKCKKDQKKCKKK